MSAHPIFDYAAIKSLLDAGRTQQEISERLGINPHYLRAIIRKLQSGYQPRRLPERNDLFLEEDRIGARLRKSCERATEALISTYGPACYAPANLPIRSVLT